MKFRNVFLDKNTPKVGQLSYHTCIHHLLLTFTSTLQLYKVKQIHWKDK